MGIDILYEFLGTLSIIFGYAEYNVLWIILTIIVISKSITLGHLNPAVTFWYYLAGKIDWKTALAYIVTQYTAAFVIFKLYK